MERCKLILFGAGRNGIQALKKYGKEKIAYFCDNAREKQGTQIEGIEVISFENMVKFYYEGYTIMITPFFQTYLIGQLELEGIYDYLIFHSEDTRFIIKNKENDEKQFAKENNLLDNLVIKSSAFDLLDDITEFAKLSKEALRMNREENLKLSHIGIQSESFHYGNLHSLIQYSDISAKNMKYFPTVSHFDCIPLYSPAFLYKTAVIMSGEYYRKKIHKRAPYVPVFAVGPYIHYAEGLYNAQKLKEKKRKNGKTIVAFLPHTIENVERSYDRKHFIDLLIQRYRNTFQSIWCCVYWADINDPVCEYAESKGIHIVTAGFRFDNKFNQRLKTILELSDAIVCGDIGTFIGYALYMGKPIGRLDISDNSTITEKLLYSDLERRLQLTDEYKKYGKDFHDLFNDKLKNTNEQKQWMSSLCGFNLIRSKEYIKSIFEICKEIWIKCEGDMERYPEAVRQMYYIYDKRLDIEKMAILKTAVGSYLN